LTAHSRLVTYNLLGGLLWGVGVPMAGFTLGNAIPSIDRYLLPVIALIVAVSLLPLAVQGLSARRHRHV
jgi:membrane-associated protein